MIDLLLPIRPAMLGSLISLKQAQEAVKAGRLEDAHDLLTQPECKGHKRTGELLEQLARSYVERGVQRMRGGDYSAAWNDLLRAEQIGRASGAADRLRFALVQKGLTETRAKLTSGEPLKAAEAAALLRARMVKHADLETLDDAAQGWMRAQELADRGEFVLAERIVDRVHKALPEKPAALESFAKDLGKRKRSCTDLLVQLHDAIERRRWGEVARLADQVLAVAPSHVEARKARSRAWRDLEPQTVLAVAPAKKEPKAVLSAEPVSASKRLLLWIDGVGGYLVCLGSRVSIGQSTPEASVDVPIFADLGRVHATLMRDAEGYLIEAVRPMQINGERAERALLASGDRITLGSACQLEFTRPVPVSASARLDLASDHKLALSLDGVLLMADTLVLGPGPQAHVCLPDLKEQVVLFRNKDGLGVRCKGALTIDGQRCKDRGFFGATAAIAGEDFSLALEPAVNVLAKK